MNSDLQFDPGSHTFTWHGAETPHATQILSDMGLQTTWYKVDPMYRARGQAVHTGVRYVNEGIYDETGTPNEEIRAYIRRYQQFVLDTGFVAEGGEQPVYSASLNAAGIPDLWGKRGDQRWLLDVKTGEQKPPGVEIQLAIYRLMLADGVDIEGRKLALKFDGVKCLLLPKDRDYKLIDVSDASYMTDAVSACRLWHRRRQWGLLPRNGV